MSILSNRGWFPLVACGDSSDRSILWCVIQTQSREPVPQSGTEGGRACESWWCAERYCGPGLLLCCLGGGNVGVETFCWCQQVKFFLLSVKSLLKKKSKNESTWICAAVTWSRTFLSGCSFCALNRERLKHFKYWNCIIFFKMLVCQKPTRKIQKVVPAFPYISRGENPSLCARRALSSSAGDLGALMKCVPFQGPSCGKRHPLHWQHFVTHPPEVQDWELLLFLRYFWNLASQFDLMHLALFLHALHYQQRNKAEFALCSLSAVGFIGIHHLNCVLKIMVNVDTASSLFNFLPFPRTSASIGCFFNHCHSSPDPKTTPNDVPSVLPSQYFLSALL